MDGFKCLPARPSKTGRAIAFGIQTKFSKLLKFDLKLLLATEETGGNKYIPVYKFVSAKGNLFKNKQEKWRSKMLASKWISETHRERNQCDDDDTQGIIKFIGNGSNGLSSNNAV